MWPEIHRSVRRTGGKNRNQCEDGEIVRAAPVHMIAQEGEGVSRTAGPLRIRVGVIRAVVLTALMAENDEHDKQLKSSQQSRL